MTDELDEYRVGLVLPKSGLSDNQMADLGARLRFITQACKGSNLKPVVLIAAQNLRRPGDVPTQVQNVLQYRAQFELRELPAYRRSILFLTVCDFLLFHLRKCDEVWCCTGAGMTATSKARGAALYRRAQEEGQRVGVRFKLVPAWVVTPPTSEQARKETKKAKARKELTWKDVF